MSESGVGLRVAAIRQNEGTFFRTPAAGLTPGALNWSGRRSSGSVNSPAGTDCSRVIEVSGNESFESPSQEDGAPFTIRGRNSTVQSATAIRAPGGGIIDEIPSILVHVSEWLSSYIPGSQCLMSDIIGSFFDGDLPGPILPPSGFSEWPTIRPELSVNTAPSGGSHPRLARVTRRFFRYGAANSLGIHPGPVETTGASLPLGEHVAAILDPLQARLFPLGGLDPLDPIPARDGSDV
jgi:hypothetical protein